MRPGRVVAIGALVTLVDFAGVGVVGLAGGALAGPYAGPPVGPLVGAATPAAEFTDEGVTVSLRLTRRVGDRATLVTTFTPRRPGFHLYSTALPADGIGGVGRPTKVEPRDGLVGAGPLAAESEVRPLTLAGTDLTLPVYPDGPVTADLPVVVTGRGRARVLISYAACSGTACSPPVTGHVVEVPTGGPSEG